MDVEELLLTELCEELDELEEDWSSPAPP